MLTQAKRKRLRRVIFRTTIALVLLWLLSSAIAAWRLTHRQGSRFAEPVNIVAAYQVEEYRLKTSDQFDIGAWLIRGDPKKPVVLVLHGNGGCRYYCKSTIEFLAGQGYGVMAITLRAHGDSAGSINDLGYSARHDVSAAVQFLQHEMPGRKIVIVGESLGAAAAIFSAKDCAGRVNAYFLAAPYTDLSTATWNRCDHFLIPPFSHAAYTGLRLWAPLFIHQSPANIRPIDYIANIPTNIPVTIYAGDGDHHTRIEEVRTMYEKIRSHADLVVVHGGGHHEIKTLHEEEYHNAVLNLLSRVQSQ